MKRLVPVCLCVAIVFAAPFFMGGLTPLTPQAHAAGSGGQDCRKGEVYSRRKGECVKKSSSNDYDADDIYQTAAAWSSKGEHAEAISVLWLADGKETAPILNLLGYSNRKLGRIDIGLAYYRQAIALDPKYTLVREYYGEGLLQKGDLAGARTQLDILGGLCGTEKCSEYLQLADAISKYEAAL